MSDIRVSVQWKSSTVFAGESIDGIITFKNTAQLRRRSPSPNTFLRKAGASRERWKDTLPLHSAPRAAAGGLSRYASDNAVPTARTGPTLAANERSGRNGSGFLTRHMANASAEGGAPQDDKKRRSVSIMSINSNVLEDLGNQGQSLKASRPNNGHSRATSMQILPRRHRATSGLSPSTGMFSLRRFAQREWLTIFELRATIAPSLCHRRSYHSLLGLQALFFMLKTWLVHEVKQAPCPPLPSLRI